MEESCKVADLAAAMHSSSGSREIEHIPLSRNWVLDYELPLAIN